MDKGGTPAPPFPTFPRKFSSKRANNLFFWPKKHLLFGEKKRVTDLGVPPPPLLTKFSAKKELRVCVPTLYKNIFDTNIDIWKRDQYKGSRYVLFGVEGFRMKMVFQLYILISPIPISISKKGLSKFIYFAVKSLRMAAQCLLHIHDHIFD